MKKLIFTFLINCLFLSYSNAQVNPPYFLCVKGDTLFWELPVNSCGPFLSYDIYAGNDINGPYGLLTSITDPVQDFYDHPNPAGELRYYYLVSNFDCPGQAQLPSDTLDSRPPEVSPLRSVSVQGGSILLNWQPSPSPEVYAYIIYRRDPLGVVPIDTVVGGNTTYLDPNAQPDTEPEGYFVNALDRCGNTSIFDQEHKTIFLEGVPTDCSVDLQWNLYQNWAGGIEKQEIWVGRNGSPPAPFDTLNGNTDSYSFRDVNDGDSYCFFIQSNENGSGEMSRSNEICFDNLSFSQPVNELFTTNVSVQPDNSVLVEWGINDGADVVSIEYYRSGNSGIFELADTDFPATPFPVLNQFLDEGAQPQTGPVTYQISAVDNCGNELTTANAATIYLNGNALDVSTNELNWTPLILNNAIVMEYKIIRSVNGSETTIGSVFGNQLTFEDVFDPSAINSGTICYIIEAKGSITQPNGMNRNITSRSNIFCIDQAIRIFAPNALAPNGINQEFKPVILSGNIARYEMQIFDRYGSIVFSTNQQDEAWKGKRGEKKLPQGVYVYRIYLVLENGREAEKKGHVLLLR